MGHKILSSVLEIKCRTRIVVPGMLALAFVLAWPAAAAELYRSEKASINLDTTVTMGVGIRVEERDETIFFKGNDPNNPALGSSDRFFSNSDDGNLNYDQFDVYSANAKATLELEANYAVGNSILTDVGAFIRMNAFYDVIGNCGHCTRRTPLTEAARHSANVIDGGVVGTQFLFLDAYADARFEVFDRLIDFRFGNQVLSWGESLFIQGGISATNGIDVAKIRVPGAELKEAFVPAPIIRVNADIIQNLSIEGYYQFWWNRTQIDPTGSFFATSDLVGRGATELFFGNDAGSGCPRGFLLVPPGAPPPPTCQTNVFGRPLLGDNDPSSQGQGGVNLRYYWNRLQTELGVYYIRYHSKTPSSGFVTTPDFSKLFIEGYFRDYADEIDMVGGSFSTTLLNIAVQGEISYRPNDSVPINASGLAVEDVLATGQPNVIGGNVREKRLQAQVSFVGNMSSSTRWGVGYVVGATKAQDIQLTGEIGVINYPDLSTQCTNRSQPPVGPEPGCIPYAGVGTADGTVDDTSWGFNLLLLFNYANPLGVPITLTPSVGWSKDFSGTSPNITFIDGRQAVTVGLELDYLQTWGFKASYANFFGAGHQNTSRDRDFYAMSISYSF